LKLERRQKLPMTGGITVVISLLLFVVCLILAWIWWGALWILIKGLFPLALLIGGLLAIALGAAEWLDRRKHKGEQQGTSAQS